MTGISEPDMLTGMTERDWSIVLEVFDAAQSNRGEPGHDDRKFQEAIHYFTVHSVTWRALPSEFGKWNSVWKRFWRLSRSGVPSRYYLNLNGGSRYLNASCLRNLGLSFALFVVVATSAAEWSYSQKGPNLLGKIESYAVGSDSGGLGGLLVIRCVGNDTLELALLEPSTASQIGAAAKLVGVTTRMFVRVDNNPVQSFDNATVEVWNRNAIGVVVEGRTPELLQLVRSIGIAKSKIAVGVNLGYNLVFRAFGTDGSTAAVNAITKACQLD